MSRGTQILPTLILPQQQQHRTLADATNNTEPFADHLLTYYDVLRHTM
jgi:hypothetical protein